MAAWFAGAVGSEVRARGMLWMLGDHTGEGASLPDVWQAGAAAPAHTEVLHVRGEVGSQ